MIHGARKALMIEGCAEAKAKNKKREQGLRFSTSVGRHLYRNVFWFPCSYHLCTLYSM